MSAAAEGSTHRTPDERLAAIFANQRRWLVRIAAPTPGVVARADGVTAICSTDTHSIALPLGRSVSGAALDTAFAALRRAPAPRGGLLVWSATGDEPPRTALHRRLLARGCDEAFRPRWMHRDLTRSANADRPTPAGIRVALAVPGDEPALAAAEQAGTPYASAPEAAALIAHGLLPAGRQRMWLLLARDENDGRVVGQVVVNLTTGRGIAGIYSMGVDAGLQRRGIGTALIRAAVDLACQRGATALGLNATPDGEQLYRTLGFTVVADGQTWYMPASRLATAPASAAVDIAEAIARGAISALERRTANLPLTDRLPNEETPLAFAARFGQKDAARWLLAHGASPEITALWTLGWRDEAAALLGDPVLRNARSGPDQLTPLHEAIYRDDRDLVPLLLTAGADLTATDARYGGTPLSWAKALGRSELVPLIEGAG